MWRDNSFLWLKTYLPSKPTHRLTGFLQDYANLSISIILPKPFRKDHRTSVCVKFNRSFVSCQAQNQPNLHNFVTSWDFRQTNSTKSSVYPKKLFPKNRKFVTLALSMTAAAGSFDAYPVSFREFPASFGSNRASASLMQDFVASGSSLFAAA